jgi:hypothetical protein
VDVLEEEDDVVPALVVPMPPAPPAPVVAEVVDDDAAELLALVVSVVVSMLVESEPQATPMIANVTPTHAVAMARIRTSNEEVSAPVAASRATAIDPTRHVLRRANRSSQC